MGDKTGILGLNAAELRALAQKIGAKPFVGGQLAHWLYQKRVYAFGEMGNVPLRVREALEMLYSTERARPIDQRSSKDGTQKLLFDAGRGRSVESALIPDDGRTTLCVSSQIGCQMGCTFCATGQQPFGGNLTSGGILNQVFYALEQADLSNIVFMGMGEPLNNMDGLMPALEVLTSSWGLAMSPRRITVSTVGVEKGLLRFIDESECHLAVSLHSPFDMERDELVPANRALPISRLMGIVKRGNWHGQRRLSFEYVVLAGINDSSRHMEALARLVRGLPCLVNLIAYHPHRDAPYSAPKRGTLETMRDLLASRGVRATIRASRGLDIEAACGMLSRTRGTDNLPPQQK